MNFLIQKIRLVCCFSLLFFSSYAFSQDTIPLLSSHNVCLDDAPGHSQGFINFTNQIIHGFTVSIEAEDGGPLPANIQFVGLMGDSLDFDVDDNLDGNIGGPNETDDVDTSPNKTTATYHAPAINTHPIFPGDTFQMDIALTGMAGTRWCLNVQPLNVQGAAVGVARSEDTGLPPQGCVEYGLQMSLDGIGAVGYNGLSFTDVNQTGGILNSVFITGFNFIALNAEQLDLDGGTIPLSNYNGLTGELQFAVPVQPGEPFSLRVIPDMYVPDEPALMTICGSPPIPSQPLPARTIAYDQYAFPDFEGGANLTNIGAFTFRYEIPIMDPEQYLQILYRPNFPESSGRMYWSVQNMVLEPFADSMDLTVYWDLDPEGNNADSVTLVELIDIYVILSDTIMEQGPVLGGPFTTETLSPFTYDVGGNLPQTLAEQPTNRIRPTSAGPRIWQNGTSEGVLIGCRMPNIDGDSLTYRPGNNGPYVPSDYAGDWNACVPMATSNSFSWLRKIHPDVDAKLKAAFGEGDSAHRKMLAEFSKLMKRKNKEGVFVFDFMQGKLAFIDKYKLPIKVSYQSEFYKGDKPSPNDCYGHKAEDQNAMPATPKGKVSRKWILDRMKDSCDVELVLAWENYGIDSMGNFTTSYHSHCVVLTGIRKTGSNYTLKYKDDHYQSRPGGTRQSQVTLDSLSDGSLYIPELSTLFFSSCYLDHVVAECHDKSITHRSIKGKAFKDINRNDNGGATAPGYEGICLELVDTTGTVVATTKTDKDGRYVFGDLPEDTIFCVRVKGLPGLWRYSTPNVGNDSVDSDFDPNTGKAPVATFGSTDTAFTYDLGLVPPSIYPLNGDLRIYQMSFSDPHMLDNANTGSIDISYYLPTNEQEYYVNIVYLPAGSSTPVWIADNFTLEPFPDTMQLGFYFDFDTSLTNSASTLPLTEGSFKLFVTDTIIPTQPIVSLWDTLPILQSGHHVGGNPLSSPIDFTPLGNRRIKLPPLPPRVFGSNSTRSALIGCSMPNFDCDSSRYKPGKNGPYVPSDYAGDWNACGPAAVGNSFQWLAGVNPVLGAKLKAAFGEGDSAHRKMVAEFSALMGRANNGTVDIKKFIEAKLAFIDKYKLPMKVTYQSMHRPEATINSPNDCYGHKATRQNKVPPQNLKNDKIDPEWIYNRLKDTCDVEILITWLVWDDFDMQWTASRGSHYVTVTGMRENRGNWRIKWKEDTAQHRAGGLFQGISNMVVDTSGFLRLPQLDRRDPTRSGFAIVSNVVAECYDPSVTFTSTKGKATEDSNGSGTSDPGEASIQGQPVILVDNVTGLDVDTTFTLPDGTFVFGDLQPGNYYMRLPSILPGFGLALPDQGTNDSIDFDFDLVTQQTPPFVLGVDDVNSLTGLGLVADSIVRLNLQAILEGPYDPLGDSMFTKLWDQGLLPPLVPQNLFGLPIDTPYQSIAIPTPPDSLIPVNLCVVQLRPQGDSLSIYTSRPAMIFNTGDILFIDPVLGYTNGLVDVLPGNYYPVLLPLGHLPIMPSQPVPLAPSQPGLSLQLQAVTMTPFGADNRINVAPGKQALRAGNANGDEAINVADRAETWNERNTTGYKQEDINYDGVINAADRAGTWNNRNTVGELPK
ncbi:MAG: SdrD B-like domain-containing protein [Bacteroidia bacterium]